MTEARAGRHACDVLETNGPEMEALYREKLLAEFHSPHFKDLPPAAFPKHRHWVADRFNFFTIGYNTNLIKPDEVPTSYEDLLHPRFAGKLGIEASDTDWFAAVVKHMGEAKGMAYFKKLAAARPQMRSGHALLAELVSSGEVPIAATIYNHNIERLIVKGAPVKWEGAEPHLRPAQRHWRGAAFCARARRAAVHRLHALAARPAAHQGPQPAARQHGGGQPAEQVPLRDDRPRHHARRSREVG